MKVWFCKVGFATKEVVPSGADAHMRSAVAYKFYDVVGHNPSFMFSGWNGQLTEEELAVVEKREPSPDASASAFFHKAMNDRLAEKRIEGFSGWEICNKQYLVDRYTRALDDQLNLIRSGLGPDPKLAVDIANFAAFLRARG